MELVHSFDGDMLTLKDCDHFVLLMKLIPGFGLRLETIYFKNTYESQNKHLNEIMETAFDFIIFLKENEKFIFIFNYLKKYKGKLETKEDKYKILIKLY